MIRNTFPLTLIGVLLLIGSVSAEPDSKNNSSQRHQAQRQKSSAAANRVLTVRDIAIFTYQPAPTRPIEVRGLRDEGLARLSINQQGVVTGVKITRSTGHRDFDADAVDAFRRWRARPGPAREIDLPLTAVTTGKKAPVRVPTPQGNLTIG